MGTLYENIMVLCEKNGIKGGKMCADLGISKGLLTDLKAGRKKGMSAATADKIASYFGVSVGYLLGTEQEKAPTREGEREIGFDDFTYAFNGEVRELTESDKQLLLSMARQLNEARKQRDGKKTD